MSSTFIVHETFLLLARKESTRFLPKFIIEIKKTENYFSFFAGGGSLDQSNKGMQMLQKMGWRGAGLGAEESGIVEPIKGGEVRDRSDQYKGMGVSKDPFESFRKQRAGAFYTRMRDKAEERKKDKNDKSDDKEEDESNEYGEYG